MNYKNPDLVFKKVTRKQSELYLSVKSIEDEVIWLEDIEHGGGFSFSFEQIDTHIKSNILIVLDCDELPRLVYDKFRLNKITSEKQLTLKKRLTLEKQLTSKKQLTSRKQLASKKRAPPLEQEAKLDRTAEYSFEIERRYTYVKGVLDESFPAYTQKRLETWLIEKGKSINDPNPPTWRTVNRWLAKFLASGNDRESLMPATHKCGNRTCKLDEAISELLDRVLQQHIRDNTHLKYQNAHNEYLKELKVLNQKRVAEGLKPLIASSYVATVKRILKLV